MAAVVFVSIGKTDNTKLKTFKLCCRTILIYNESILFTLLVTIVVQYLKQQTTLEMIKQNNDLTTLSLLISE